MTPGERGSAKEMPERVWIQPLLPSTEITGRRVGCWSYQSGKFDGDTEYIRADKYAELRRLAERVSETWAAYYVNDSQSREDYQAALSALCDFLKQEEK